MYKQWCTVLTEQRAALERARDARVGNLGNSLEHFIRALTEFDKAVQAHKEITGCDLMH